LRSEVINYILIRHIAICMPPVHGKDEYPGPDIGLAIVIKIVDNQNGIR